MAVGATGDMGTPSPRPEEISSCAPWRRAPSTVPCSPPWTDGAAVRHLRACSSLNKNHPPVPASRPGSRACTGWMSRARASATAAGPAAALGRCTRCTRNIDEDKNISAENSTKIQSIKDMNASISDISSRCSLERVEIKCMRSGDLFHPRIFPPRDAKRHWMRKRGRFLEWSQVVRRGHSRDALHAGGDHSRPARDLLTAMPEVVCR
jgi:hypothetical protein